LSLSSLAAVTSSAHGFFLIGSPVRIGLVRPLRTGRRPVLIAARVGVQVGCEYVDVRRRPPRARASMCGVGEPTLTPPP